MAVSVTHTTQTAKPNDPTKDVSANAWNEAHTVTGLENVDNTSDVNKPVSTAQSAADQQVILWAMAYG